MLKIMIIAVILNLSLLACLCTAWKEESATNNGGASSSPQAVSTPPLLANSNKSASSNKSNSKQESNPPSSEPSADELQNLIPSEVRRRMRCSIEENVTVTPGTAGLVPLTITFDAKDSKAPCGKIVKWYWDFGDGSKGKGSKVTHTYKIPGEYIANLSMIDNNGNTNLTQLDYVLQISTEKPAKPISKTFVSKPRSERLKISSEKNN